MRSIWQDTCELPAFEKLRRDIQTDVLIIGGGMAGLLCAYLLERQGVDYALLEADRICGGVTGNTTAKITSQHGLIYSRLLRCFGAEKARLYYDANEAALAEYRALCREIDCGFETRDAIVYSLHDCAKLERELAALKTLGVCAKPASADALPFPVAGAIRFPDQAQFHPLRFAAAISKGLRIYEHSRVRALFGLTAVTDYGKVAAGRIIVATHFPFLNKHGSYFLKMYQHRSYVLALKNAPDVGDMYVDESDRGLSFRNYEGLLLLGGGGRRTGKRGGGWRELEDCARQYYPHAREAYRFAAQDCITLDGAPYIGEYSARTEGLYVATGFNKWGMTSSMVAAMLLAERMQGKPSRYSALFSPSRSMLHPQLACNAAEAAASLLTPTSRRCPHMGCALKWNPQERSWDCTCHGSRFTANGRLLDNPATGDLKPRGKA